MILKQIKENKLLFVLFLTCIVAIIVMIAALCMPKTAKQEPFTPPPFDENAVLGIPDVHDDLGYNILYREGMSFKVGICGRINVTDNSAEVYLTNVAENNVWLKVRFYNADGEILGESGLIKPGEYLKTVTVNNVSSFVEDITVKVISYEPGTYKSLGAVTLTPKISITAQ